MDIDCEEIFKVLPVQALFQIFFSKAELCVCACATFSKNTASFFCSGLDARERVRLKKTTARRVFHRRRATMAASVLITCYNISERALAKSPKARARFEV